MPKGLSVVYLTNIPAPYRERQHELMAGHYENYVVIYCAGKEPNRKWSFQSGNYKRIVLSDDGKKMVHNNRNILKHLKEIKPDVVISSGFNPTMLYAFIWTLFNRKKFIPYTDGTFDSEQSLSFVHRIVRRIVFRFSDAFVGTGVGSKKLFQSYKINPARVFTACLCIDNLKFRPYIGSPREYDLMFSGQLIDRKMPLFFADLIKRLQRDRPGISVLIVGDGPLKKALIEKLDTLRVKYHYAGFVQPHELPAYYGKARLFAFPTLNDPWGIVANEACAAGVPVMTCSRAGVANDLIRDGVNGFIMEPDVELWAAKIDLLLGNADLYRQLSANAVESVEPYNHRNAVKGLIAAINTATNNNEPSPSVRLNNRRKLTTLND